jgi:hypothetical protein
MASGAGKQASWFLSGNSQFVTFTWGWPVNQAMAWDIHCRTPNEISGADGPSPPQMGLVLPPGTQFTITGETLTYYFLVQNAGGQDGEFDLCYLYHSF